MAATVHNMKTWKASRLMLSDLHSIDNQQNSWGDQTERSYNTVPFSSLALTDNNSFVP